MDRQQAGDLLDDDLACRLDGPVAVVAAFPFTFPASRFLVQRRTARAEEKSEGEQTNKKKQMTRKTKHNGTKTGFPLVSDKSLLC